MDKNQTAGLIIISLLIFAYFQITKPEFDDNSPIADSVSTVYEREVIANDEPPIEKREEKTAEEIAIYESSPVTEEAQNIKYGILAPSAKGESISYTLENDLLRIEFDSKGAIIKSLELKEYKIWDKETPLILLDELNNTFAIETKIDNRSIKLKDLFYTVEQTDTAIIFKASAGEGRYIKQSYSLLSNKYQVSYDLEFVGLGAYIDQDDELEIYWEVSQNRLEEDLNLSRQSATINYRHADEDFDYLSLTSSDTEEETLINAEWFSFKQKFFNAAIIPTEKFKRVNIALETIEADTTLVKNCKAWTSMKIKDLSSSAETFTFYFGPNRFNILKDVAPDFNKNINLGGSIIGWINRYLIIPVFNVLDGSIASYGLIIFILVLFIKIILFPLTYKSYMSMAKTKVLKPEMDELKAKHGDDQQGFQKAQMELYRQVGVNPLSGCIPMVLQMPILFAMFRFFPNSIELRQESFLWAHDLSTYDVFVSLPFTIPMYGDHVSLFTLLMTLSTILYTWSNNQMQTVSGPMKNMGYIMPVMFLFVLNSFSAGLTYYYFLSNIITFGQQALIKRFVDDSKIRATLDLNKTSNVGKKKSKFQQRLDNAMKTQEANKKK